MTTTKYLKFAVENLNYSIKFRRDFHQYPELGFQENRTSEIIARELESNGYEVSRFIGKTGVIGILKGNSNGPTILLRFDMDALPIVEENSTDYISKNHGVMHACGHDGHMAIGLTVAKILSELRDNIQGTIKFIFQPAEEGLGGALATILDGVLENPKPDFVLGLHLWNEKPIGWFGINNGPMMAGSDTFEINIIGKGGHGGLPHKAIDPIVTAAQIIQAVQTIVSRNVSPLESAVISFGSIHGGTAFNIIPEVVKLTGTIRTFNPEVRNHVVEKIKLISTSICEGMNCQSTFRLDEITPAVINSEKVVASLLEVINEQYDDAIIDDHCQTMGSEDFSLFLNQVPGCFYFVGSSNPDRNLIFSHHHPKFDFDENVFPYAVSSILGMVQKLGCISGN